MKKIYLALVLIMISLPCSSMENLFYILRGSKIAEKSLSQHGRAINILTPQAYHVNEHGKVSGEIDNHVLKYANIHHAKLMPLITNSLFDQEKAHQFLSDSTAQTEALQSILLACKQNHFYGVQFDFENIHIKDKVALTNFYQRAYNLLHPNKFVVSLAIVPETEDIPSSSFEERKFNNWTGAYDLKSLAKYSDFVTIMSYDQHTAGSTPGPTASSQWVEATIKHTLKFIPANKISLGIPLYSGHWYTGKLSSKSTEIKVHLAELGYQEAMQFIKKNHLKLKWDEIAKNHYAIYQRHWLNQYLFVEDTASFAAKTALAKKYHLRGLSVFDLGIEDPKIWKNSIFKSAKQK